MKFIIAVLASIAAVNAVAIKGTPTLPDRTSNWETDPLNDFDNKHFANNNVAAIFPDHVNIPNAPTIWRTGSWIQKAMAHSAIYLTEFR